MHLAAQDALQRPPLARRSVDVERRARRVGGHEEREPLDVVPVRVADEQVDGEGPPTELLREREAQLADAGPGIEDEDVLAGSELDAGRVPPVQRRGGAGRRNRASRAPEGHAEPGSGAVGLQALHACHQLVGVEGLHHVLVGAHLLRADDVRLVRLRGDHDDDGARQLGIRAQGAQHLEAVHVVHDDVADDDRGPVGLRERDAVGALPRGEHVEAAVREDEGEELEERLVVVDHEEGLAGCRRRTGRRRHGVREEPGLEPGRPARNDPRGGTAAAVACVRKLADRARIGSSDVTVSGRFTDGTRAARPPGLPRTCRLKPQPSFPASRVGH